MKLIAVVATAVLLDGVRTIIQPGEELPSLPEHDQRELLASGAAENPATTAAAEKAAAGEQDAAAAEFAAMREAVQQAQASTASDAEPEAKAPAPATKAARK
jgi:hypothetical protein